MTKLKNNRGLTLIELMITIGVGSIVITMLISILSTTMLTKNKADYENRLLNESYVISEYIQNQIFELGARSVTKSTGVDSADQILTFRHEYDIESSDAGAIFRNYSSSEAYVLFYDALNQNLHYGPASEFNESSKTFLYPDETRINSQNVAVESLSISSMDEMCIANGEFYDPDLDPNPDDEIYENVTRCASAIIEIDITLTYLINDNPLFDPMYFKSTIIF